MTMEELSNLELLTLFKHTSRLYPSDEEYLLELQEEIFSRMEGEGA